MLELTTVKPVVPEVEPPPTNLVEPLTCNLCPASVVVPINTFPALLTTIVVVPNEFCVASE